MNGCFGVMKWLDMVMNCNFAVDTILTPGYATPTCGFPASLPYAVPSSNGLSRVQRTLVVRSFDVLMSKCLAFQVVISVSKMKKKGL